MNSEKFSIDKAPLGQKAANIIRQRIIEGIYAQGSRLIEEKLASEFNISRNCIREAFLILESEGMVRSERNKYTKVLKLKQKEIEDLFLFRMTLEMLSIETCIQKNCIPVEKLNHCVKKLDKMMNKKAMNSFEYVEADLNFHETIVLSSHNMYVINIYKSIKYQLMTLLFSLYNMFKEDFSVQGMGQHYKIAAFMEKGDIKSAQDFLREHIQNNLDYVIKLNERAESL
jgi:DNA-binding GntR family transcriptional regulator